MHLYAKIDLLVGKVLTNLPSDHSYDQLGDNGD